MSVNVIPKLECFGAIWHSLYSVAQRCLDEGASFTTIVKLISEFLIYSEVSIACQGWHGFFC